MLPNREHKEKQPGAKVKQGADALGTHIIPGLLHVRVTLSRETNNNSKDMGGPCNTNHQCQCFRINESLVHMVLKCVNWYREQIKKVRQQKHESIHQHTDWTKGIENINQKTIIENVLFTLAELFTRGPHGFRHWYEYGHDRTFEIRQHRKEQPDIDQALNTHTEEQQTRDRRGVRNIIWKQHFTNL
jgi:hypothetical protein